MKKFSLFLVVTILAMGLMLLSGGTALANYGPHGGYGTWTDDGDGLMTADEVNPDSDACAGCHRAHTAVSSITWEDNNGGLKNALLIGSTATTIKEFCYTCHTDVGAGAGTDVQAGVYVSANVEAQTTPGYITDESENGAVLNGGGFEEMNGDPVTSLHTVSGGTEVAWGGGTTGPGVSMTMDCVDCHDPHGSSNYRILKDKVNGVDVGGYEGGIDGGIDPNPTPFVISNEVGYPTGGFRLHRNYGDEGYAPDYTEARYARPVGMDTDKGMSGWCAACHTQYNTTSSSGQGAYDAGDGYTAVVRHRHPVNQPLSTFAGDRSLLIGTTTGTVNVGLNDPWNLEPTLLRLAVDIPLEHDAIGGTEGQGEAQVSSLEDFIGCMTCHRAHGSTAVMTGYANVASSLSPTPGSGTGGVAPANDSALLRADNRGVCERCHNK